MEETIDDPITMDLAPALPAETNPEKFHSQSTPHGANGLPSGGDDQWSPSGSNQLESTIGESHPLIRSPPEAIELSLWTAPEQENCEGGLVLSEQKHGCCCCSGCFKSGRVPAFCSTVACLLCLPGLLYALYLYAPIEAPLCPDTTSRLVFTLSCCAVAAVPILIGELGFPLRLRLQHHVPDGQGG